MSDSPEEVAAHIAGTYDDSRLASSVAGEVVAALREAGLLAEGDIQYTGHGRTFVIEEGELQPGEATAWRRLSKWIPMPVVDTETRDEQ